MDTGALQLMFQNGMPSMAAMNMGQGMAADREMAAQKLRAATMENDQSAVMNPLNAQFRRGQIDQQGAELPGIQGVSQSRAAQGSEDTQLLASKVAEKISNMQTQIGANGMQQMGQDAEKLLHAAQIIKQLPPAMQKQAFAKAMQQYGGSADNPMFKGLMQAPDAEFQKSAEALGQGMALSSSKFVQTQTAALSHQASQASISAADNTSREKIAQIQADSRKAVAETRLKATKHMSTDQAIAFLTMAPDRTPAEEDQLIALRKQKLEERAAGANAVAPNVLGQDNPLMAAAKAAEASRTKPGTGHGDLDQHELFSKMAAAQKLPYDTSKFKYRIGPNGQLQSAPK